jgi:hypothetical protein
MVILRSPPVSDGTIWLSGRQPGGGGTYTTRPRARSLAIAGGVSVVAPRDDRRAEIATVPEWHPTMDVNLRGGGVAGGSLRNCNSGSHGSRAQRALKRGASAGKSA